MRYFCTFIEFQANTNHIYKFQCEAKMNSTELKQRIALQTNRNEEMQ